MRQFYFSLLVLALPATAPPAKPLRPDLTRVEVMDFTPSKDPCCHSYTAPHPIP
jgi:hypothetical protein